MVGDDKVTLGKSACYVMTGGIVGLVLGLGMTIERSMPLPEIVPPVAS
jgi:hypothetical protein